MLSLSPKVIRSGLWSLGGNWLSRGVGILKIVILARLLSPFDFGILGLATLSVNLLNVFSETGIESALIQKEKIEAIDLDTAWTFTLVRGFLLFVILFFSAGWVSAYYENDALKPVIETMSISFLLLGFTNVGIVYFQKKFEFKKKVFLESSADIIGSLTAIVLALWLRNVWALVAAAICWAIVKCVGSYIMHPYRPRIRIDKERVFNLLNFGKHIFWIGLMAFIITSFGDALVGKLLGVTILGFYSMAFNIANFPVSSLTGVLSQVLFPAYSAIQKEPKRAEKAFIRAFEATVIFLFPFMTMMIILSESFTALFLGEQWLPMVPSLKVLCVFGLLRSISSLYYPLHLALKPANQTKIKIVDVTVFIVIIYPLTINYGIVGTSCALSFVYLVNVIINTLLTKKMLQLNVWKLLSSLRSPLLISLTMMMVALSINLLKLPTGKLVGFFVLLVPCLVFGIGGTFILERKFLKGLFEDMKEFAS